MPSWPDYPPDKFTACVVEWEDAQSNASMQAATVDMMLATYTPCIRRSVGYWAGETDDVLVIFSDDDRTSEFPEGCGGAMYIPRSLVRRVEPLRTPKVDIK